MKKIFWFWLVFFAPCFAAAAGGLQITQVQIEGDGGAGDEFVEIYNSGDACMSLAGWSLQYKPASGSFPLASKKLLPDVLLPPGAYFLAAGSQYNGSIAADLSHASFSLSASAAGATIFLSSSGSGLDAPENPAVADRFGYGNSASNTPSGAALAVPADAGKPAEDWAYLRTGFAGDNAADFVLAAAAPRSLLGFAGDPCAQQLEPAPTTTPDGLSTSTPDSQYATGTPKNFDVKIYRFLPDPAGEDSGNEWVELKNSGQTEASMEGWLLDDKNTGSGPGADAWVLSGSIAPGEAGRWVVPPAHFALNNTGGDEVNLYFPDRSLADSAAYSAPAYADGAFEFSGGVWQPPVQSGGGSGGGSSVQVPQYSALTGLKISEVFPNPQGDDAGNEWVEIYNPGPGAGSLQGFYLDIGELSVVGGGAYVLPKVEIPAKGYAEVLLPKNSLALKNAGKEKIKFFTPGKELADAVEYENAPENRSWQKNPAGAWEWNLPSPGEENLVPEVPSIIFSEILASPGEDQDEFVELYNLATSTASLGGFALDIGSRTKIFPAGERLSGQSYLVLYADDLPVALRNSGQSLRLRDAWGRRVAEASYPAAKKGQSFASLDGEGFLWTNSITPGGDNQLVLGQAVQEPALEQKIAQPKKTSSKPAASLGLAEAELLLQQNQQLAQQLAVLQESIEELSEQVAGQPAVQAQPQNSGFWWAAGKYLLLALACGIFLFWLLKFLSKPPQA